MLPGNGKSAARRDVSGVMVEALNSRCADGVIRMPDIESGADDARDDVTCSRLYLEPSNGRNEAACTSRFLLHGTDPFGRSGQRIAAKVHGCGSGMVGLALEDHTEAALAGNSLYNTQREAEGFEYRTLLDVKLKVGESVVPGSCVADCPPPPPGC